MTCKQMCCECKQTRVECKQGVAECKQTHTECKQTHTECKQTRNSLPKNFFKEKCICLYNDSYDGLRGRVPVYNREAAVRYAETWWNSYNPAYPKFDDDCTNYVSQCLRAGGAPFWGSPDREKGWWLGSEKWSFSWSTAHSLRWYLAGSNKGMTATQVGSAEQLDIGDVIVYDFQNDGRYDHSTIVTAKDGAVPLVNAHTFNTRHRHWAYKDSYASTPEARYIFFKINDYFA